MAEVYPTAIEDAQPIGLGRADSKSNQDVEAVKGVSDIELLAANIDPIAQSR
jgi:hypothetical protein